MHPPRKPSAPVSPNQGVADPAQPPAGESAPSAGGVAPTPPTTQELTQVLKYPMRTKEELKHLLPAPVDYPSVLTQTIEVLDGLGNRFVVPGVSLDALIEARDQRNELLPVEQKLTPFYARAYDNRRIADSQGMKALLTINRVVKSSKNPELMASFRFLSESISSHKPKNTKATKEKKKTSGDGSGGDTTPPGDSNTKPKA